MISLEYLLMQAKTLGTVLYKNYIIKREIGICGLLDLKFKWFILHECYSNTTVVLE
jgi:hypothetical protein